MRRNGGKRDEEKNEKGEWRNEGCVLWRGMERGKLWIGVWMRENFVENERDARERVGE